MSYSGAKIAKKIKLLKNKNIQKVEKQKQCISENGKNLKKQQKNESGGKKWWNFAVQQEKAKSE